MDCGIDGKTFTEPSLCHTEFAMDCDLKLIIKRFMATGQLPPSVEGFSGDFTNTPQSFDDLQIQKATIHQRFEQLPIEEQLKFESPEDWYLSILQDTPKDTPKDTPQDTPQDTPKDTPKDGMGPS